MCLMTEALSPSELLFFFFNDTATTEIYTLSLHDALPILVLGDPVAVEAELVGEAREVDRVLQRLAAGRPLRDRRLVEEDRKSTRLNSSHANISYAVFCLKKKKK